MAWVLIILSTFFLAIGHYFKTLRWEKFINIYEQPNKKILIRSLSLGYIINFILPFRIGDLFRAFYSGRKMNNGTIFSLSTIVLDRLLDIFVVGIIFAIILIYDLNMKTSALFYIILSLFFIVIVIISFILNKYIKRFIKSIASIFNEKIELKIMKFFWSFITSFKDMLFNINKLKLVLNTVVMWSFYLTSYLLLAVGLNNLGSNTSFVEIFSVLFAKNNINGSTLALILNLFNSHIVILIIYLILPLILLLVFSALPFKLNSKITHSERRLALLPQINAKERLEFLEEYFSGNSREYIKNYLSINRDISIIKDYSAGSNATTMLCTLDDKMFFRKYAIGLDSDKLYDQIKWIDDHKKDLPLTKISQYKKEDLICFYDMPYKENAVSCFNFVHSNPVDTGWKVLENVLNDLDNLLHKKYVVKADNSKIKEYIDNKVLKNINIIESSLKNLVKFDNLVINGKTYKNLNQFKNYLSYDYLYDLFKDDAYSEIHGDLTIENIICIDKDYYLIDPNTGNVHNSPNLDYGKLLQSLHGGYEFLMNTKNVEVYKNNINYISTKSSTYEKLFTKYKNYLENKYDLKVVKSIFFHEIIHWLRLMPYKIKKDKERAVLFYCGLIIVLNDVIDFYCKGEKNEK